MSLLIVFSHLRWDFVFQRPQHLMTRLARHHRICFIEEPLRTDGPAHLEVRDVSRAITVLRPHTALSQPGFNDAQNAVVAPLLQRWLSQQPVDERVAWLYTPMALPLLRGLDVDRIIYDCMDELSAFKGAPAQMRSREAELLHQADIVLTGGPSLFAAKRRLHPHVVCLPSAVDAAHFAPRGPGPASEHDAAAARLQSHIARPRLGAFGVIDERLDLDLLAAVSRARPEWQLVLVGPVVKIDPDSLPRAPNIHWLGQQPYERLPALVSGWDVCLLPFALNEHTRFISPTKTLEYLAAHKPCVSTPVRDVADLYGDAVSIAAGSDAFIAACDSLLHETPAAALQRLEASADLVATHSWDQAAAEVQRLIEHALAAASTAKEASSLTASK